MESFLPRHYRFFPQVRQALSASDGEYLDRLAPRDVAQTVHRERRAVARQFLAGLHEDFSSLERLARMVAALSPVISSEQEKERLILGLNSDCSMPGCGYVFQPDLSLCSNSSN